jgi:hypothetical protein
VMPQVPGTAKLALPTCHLGDSLEVFTWSLMDVSDHVFSGKGMKAQAPFVGITETKCKKGNFKKANEEVTCWGWGVEWTGRCLAPGSTLARDHMIYFSPGSWVPQVPLSRG